MKRTVGIATAALAAALLVASASAATKLAVPDAAERSARHAERTCAHDPKCVGSGVLNCRRDGARVVVCRVYDERRTRLQGRYRCNRQVRIALDPATDRRLRVTGIGKWHC